MNRPTWRRAAEEHLRRADAHEPVLLDCRSASDQLPAPDEMGELEQGHERLVARQHRPVTRRRSYLRQCRLLRKRMRTDEVPCGVDFCLLEHLRLELSQKLRALFDENPGLTVANPLPRR